jgi:hypothetical protein
MMSYPHRIDREERVVHITIDGDVTMESLHAARDAVLADPAYTPGMNVFIDCRVITALPTPDEIRSLALRELMSPSGIRHGRIAIVATTAKSYQAAQLFELFTDAPGDRLGVFTDPVAARAWLATASRPTAS